MGWNKILVISIILLSSCKNYYINEKGGYRPKNSKFKLSKPPYKLIKDDLIDVNSIYVNITKVSYGTKTDIDNSIIRFFSNGHYLENLEPYTDNINLKKLNNVNNSLLIGYYKIENKKNITIDYYSVKKAEGGSYHKREGYIRNDSLFLFYDSFKNKEFPKPNKKNCRIYIRKKVDGLTGTPDW